MALTEKEKKQEEMNVKNETASANNTATGNSLKGVDEATTQKMNSTFTASDNQVNAQNNANSALTNLGNLTNKDKLVSDKTYDILGSSFQKPESVKAADKWIANQLSVIQSGKTSYTDQVKNMMDKISGREKFSYDVDSDPLFQQALASAMNSGKVAMQDTIGQASALTGGYGSTYATSVGNQAYNAFIQDAYDNLPQYYQMAMEAYQMEGEEMYRQLDMYNAADDKEYNRNVTAYDATYQHRNQMYNEAYQLHRDAKTDALNIANLKISEHGQLVSDAYNYYNASSNYADTLYNREYNSWLDTVNQAFKNAELLNNDYWSQTNFDEGVRQYEKSFAEQQRQFDTSFAEEQRQFDKTYEQNDRHHKEDMGYKWATHNQNQANWEAEFDEDKRRYDQSVGDTNGDGKITDAEYAKFVERYGSNDGGKKDGYYTAKDPITGEDVIVKEPTETQYSKALKAYNEGGQSGMNKYMNSLPSDVDKQKVLDYIDEYGDSWVADWDYYNSFTMSNDTHNGGFLWFDPGEDHDDEFSSKGTYGDEKEKTYTYDELKEKINNSSMPQDIKDELLKKLKGASKK